MQHRRIATVALLLAGMAITARPVAAQTSLLDIEVGYQWVDITGNEDVYRTQINQGDGLVINDLTVNLIDTDDGSGLFDRLRIDAAGFGGSPAGRFSLVSDLGEVYTLRLTYQQYQSFSALPGWANPFVDQGVVPGQHTWDRDRDLLDLELELLPGRIVTPIVGYLWNQIDGPRRTTYHVGQDEFQLDSEVEETEQEFRVGLAFAAGKWRGAVIQGWRDFESSSHARLADGDGDGNSSRPVLGTDVTADSIDQAVHSEADTPVTTASVSGGFGDRIRLDATYLRSDWQGDTAAEEVVVGSLVSFQLGRFFESLEQSISSRTENPSWRGAIQLGLDLTSNVVLDLSYELRDRELEGWALISNLYLDTLNFGGTDPRDLTVLVEANNGYRREDDIATALLRVSDLGPLFLWAEGSILDTSLDVSQAVAEVVVPGGQSGGFERSVDRYELGAGVDVGDLRLQVDYRAEDADDAIVRTDFLDRSRVRGRIDWRPFGWLRVLGTAETIDAENNDPGIDLDAQTDHYAVDLDLSPTEDLTLRAAWDQYQTDSVMLIREPHDLDVVSSLHSEDGELLEAGVLWRIARFDLDVSYSTFENVGSFPFQLDRGFARLGFDLTDAFSAAVEYETQDYSEAIFTPADFDAERYGVFIRWRN